MAETKAWICTVCGYVHQGDVAPDVCPLCGATQELFEPHEEPKVAKVEAQAWICTICGYIADGTEPPSICPLCGAGADMFEPYEKEGGGAVPKVISQDAKHVVIAGAGIAGVSAAEALRKASPDAIVFRVLLQC